MKDMLLGRLALVTGAGRGNGAAIARGLAAAGAEVIVTDIDKDAARIIADSIVAEGGKARGFMLDVTDEEGCAQARARRLAAGRPDPHPGQQRRHLPARQPGGGRTAASAGTGPWR